MNELFGTKHLIIIAVSVVLIIALIFLTKKLKFKTLCRIMLVVGIVSEIIKIFFYIIKNEAEYGGVLPKEDLPFQLCSMQIIFIAILNFSKNENLKRVILSFMMPSCLFGGLAAIMIATYSSLNFWIITLQYFIFHIAIIVFAINLMVRKEFKWTAKDYGKCMAFLLVVMFFAFYINSMMYDGQSNTNFMYVVSPPQAGLPFLNENNGWLIYIIHYAILVVFCVTICYIKPIIVSIKGALSRRKDKNLSSGENNVQIEPLDKKEE